MAGKSSRGRRYYRNRSGIDDSWVPGIGISIESCPSLESVSESVSNLSLNLAPFNVNSGTKGTCCPIFGHPLIRGRESIKESTSSCQNRIGLGIAQKWSESVLESNHAHPWNRYRSRNRPSVGQGISIGIGTENPGIADSCLICL